LELRSPGEVSSNKGDEDRANPTLLLRKAARTMRAGLFPPRPLNTAEIGAASRLSSGCFMKALRAIWLAVLDLTVGYGGGDNGENHRDQWPRVESARKEFRRQHNEERYSRGQDGDDDRQRTAVTAPGAVDQNTSPVSGCGRDQPGEGEEEEHVRYGDAGDSDPHAGENTLEDLICLHDAGPRSSWKPGIVGAFYPDVGGHHALGANGPPARGA
jgi:hypothetical protein